MSAAFEPSGAASQRAARSLSETLGRARRAKLQLAEVQDPVVGMQFGGEILQRAPAQHDLLEI